MYKLKHNFKYVASRESEEEREKVAIASLQLQYAY